MSGIGNVIGGGTRSEAEYDASNNLIFWGTSAAGSLTSAAVWRIVKFTYDASNNLLTAKWADKARFTQVWDDRGSLSYT